MSFIQAHCGTEVAAQQLDSCGGEYPVLGKQMVRSQNNEKGS
jgi:hypothetical protein